MLKLDDPQLHPTPPPAPLINLPERGGWTTLGVDQIRNIAKTYGPPAIALGVLGAGVKNWISSMAQLKADREQKQNKDTLTVEIPQKTAGAIGDLWSQAVEGVKNIHFPEPPQTGPSPNVFWDPAMEGAATLGGLALGYYPINALIMAQRKKNLENQLDSAKNEYSHLLGASLASPAKMASLDALPAFPAIDGFCKAIVEKFSPSNHKEALGANVVSTILGGPLLLAELAAVGSHIFVNNRLKEMEALHTDKPPGPPKQIRLVSAPEQAALPDQTDEDEKQRLALEPTSDLSSKVAAFEKLAQGTAAAAEPIRGIAAAILLAAMDKVAGAFSTPGAGPDDIVGHQQQLNDAKMQINQIDEIGNQLSNGSENYSPNPGILSRNGPIRQFIHNHLGIGPGPETPPVQQLPAPATPEVAQHAVATAQKLYKFNPNLAQDPRFKNLASTYGFNVNATPPPAAATPPVPPAAGVSKPISPPGNLANVSFKGGALPVPAISGTAAIPSPIPISKAPAVSGSMATPKPVAKPSPLVSGSAAPPGAAPAPSNDQLIKDLHRSGIFVRFEKGGADLSPGSPARSEVPKKDFVYKEKSPKGSEVHGSYPIPDEAHARAALGFAAMHHGKDSATYRAVASKVHAKFPEMGKKALLAAQPGMGLMVLLSDAMEKTAIDLPEVAGGLMVAGSVGGEADPSQAPKPPTGAHAKATQIDNRTGQIVTPDGNIVVDDSAAHDPQFRQRLNRLAVLMASAEARGNAV